MVTVSDITPIGQNYEAFITGFNIYGSADLEGPWELVDSIARPDPPAEGAFLVSYDLAARNHECYQVVPHDSDSLEGQESAPCGYVPEPAEVTLGVDTVVSTQTIGTAGGTISAPGGSPIEGVSMTFPAGALPADTEVSLGYNDGTVDLPIGELVLPILVIDVGDVYEFDEPAQITVPFTGDEDMIPLALYMHDDGRLDGMQAVSYDYEADTFTFETFHASPIIRADVYSYDEDEPSHLRVSTGFRIVRDEFWVLSRKTAHTADKELGMTAFAAWYFDPQNPSERKGLFTHYRNVVTLGPPPKFGQDIIATRAQIAVHRYSTDYASAIIERGLAENDKYNFNAIYSMIAMTGQPQIILLSGPAGRRVLLAFSYSVSTSLDKAELYVYDPNASGAFFAIPYDVQGASFEIDLTTPGAYDRLIYFGTGTIRYAESFSDILIDADQEFHGSADATIDIRSHQSGEEVSEPEVDISGFVYSGEIKVDELAIINGPTESPAALDVNGEFVCTVPIHAEGNELQFVTRGYNEDNRLVDVHNNLLSEGFTLIGAFPPAEIDITSHTSGQDVGDRNIVLSGNIVGGTEQVEQVIVKVKDDEQYSASVSGDGSFSLPMSVRPDLNSLEFITQRKQGETWVDVKNDLDPGEFTLNGNFESTKAYVEVRWKTTMDLALNLWIIHPDGEYSGYGHYSDASFGWHNYNDCVYTWYVSTEGAGTIQWGGLYKVRLQFYHDHIAEPPGEDLPYTVRVRIHENTPNEVNYTFTGVAPFEPFHHPTDLPAYWEPLCDLPGWTDAGTFTPTQP